ncbi:hypothetical protein LQF61_00595 [Tetragenococcus koreensis]|uniref:Uncharacterized protein n=1 Tax=Tetragenococcus koreensis TaxID=290335 RepID=A0AAN4UDB0_9ENTE|nr:hypothetical protein [Tetragenococcus koreensis]AYW45113.1 hypothetical protein C7K43_03685 [Tetragenococcus koreensis]MCF1584317.1 hypothetical protein [Tetragenococcus koreensis]MCF1613866.1 hypothetical protein [Tetragenococcus koreensis]MCF1616058.1 hypothetical protein [Tetragenococcus koreensis]MCF1618590.1 hypothetical protein [Tetragenococcus koreensis]
MTVKRFVQLFICYFISMALAILITQALPINNVWLFITIASLMGYLVLVIPLTILTILKNRP